MKTNYLCLSVMICVCCLGFIPRTQAGMVQEHEITLKRDSVISVKVGEKFSIRLHSDAEQGYMWIPEVPEGIDWLSHDYDPSEAVEILWFTAGKAGVSELILRNSNTFVADVVKATLTYTVVVES